MDEAVDFGLLAGPIENDYVKEWVSNRLLAGVQKTMSSIVGREVEVKFVVRTKEPAITSVD